jgi:hypothetical protein
MNLLWITASVGARLAREEAIKFNIDVGLKIAFAGKPRSYRFRLSTDRAI